VAEPIEMPFRMWTSGLRWEPRSPMGRAVSGGGYIWAFPNLPVDNRIMSIVLSVKQDQNWRISLVQSFTTADGN